MDSKLVVEQMAGRWKIKHPDMKPLAIKAQSARAVRHRVDLGAARAELGRRRAREQRARRDADPDQAAEPVRAKVVVPKEPSDLQKALQGWGAQVEPPTQLIFLRHGETPYTAEKRFSGSGRRRPGAQRHRPRRRPPQPPEYSGARRAASTRSSRRPCCGPGRPPRSSARGSGSSRPCDDGWVECSFGDWDGHTFAEVQQKWPDQLSAWLESTTVAPPGGESFDACARRARSARDGLLTRFPGKTVVVVTHVTPIKLMVRSVLQAPMASIFRMELRPATLTEIHWYADGLASLRSFNVVP